MPNFSSLARQEVPEKFLWGGVGGWGLRSHYIVKPNLVLMLGWGFDNMDFLREQGVPDHQRLHKSLTGDALP